MYIQDFIEYIRLSENNTHLFKDESECNMSARFAFPSIMFFNTRIYIWTNQNATCQQDSPSHWLCSSILVVYIWMNQNATCQQDSPSGIWSYSWFEQYQYIYTYMYHVPKFQTIYTRHSQHWSRHYYYYQCCCCCCVVVILVASCFPLACFLIRLHLSDKNCFLPEKQMLCFLRLYCSFLFQS